MTKWIFGAIVFGLLAASFTMGCLSSLNTVDRVGVHFLGGSSGRYGFTTSDRAGAMGFAAFISGLGCVGCVAASIRSRRNLLNHSDEAADASAWKCASCGEENPWNFEECWKCQKIRGKERPV
jgi:hypothetical protein